MKCLGGEDSEPAPGRVSHPILRLWDSRSRDYLTFEAFPTSGVLNLLNRGPDSFSVYRRRAYQRTGLLSRLTTCQKFFV